MKCSLTKRLKARKPKALKVAEPKTRLARAKVNLSLHVTGQRADGYHLLDSLVVFPAVGDLLEVEPSHGLSLTIDGRFAGELDAGGGNAVIKAAERLGGPGAALHLTKNLPVAAGLGGGSADAAAAMVLLCDLWGMPLPDDKGLSLGADVPVCLESRPVRMRGIGEVLEPVPALPPMGIVLVNSGAAVSTPAVFQALSQKANPAMDMPEAWADQDAFLGWLSAQRNDLESPAREVEPGISEVLAQLEACPSVRLVRMSGSGGTCFGLCESLDAALEAAQQLQAARPSWWCVASPL